MPLRNTHYLPSRQFSLPDRWLGFGSCFQVVNATTLFEGGKSRPSLSITHVAFQPSPVPKSWADLEGRR